MALFHHLGNNLRPGGVIYGTTVLGKGIKHNMFGRLLMTACNSKGVFDNKEDSEDELKEYLEDCFENVETKVVGKVFLFKCQRPKGPSSARASG